MRKSVKKSHLRLTGTDYLDAVLGGDINREYRDCTVRALQTAMDIPYWKAHRFFAKNGRKVNGGAYTDLILGSKSRVLFGHRLGKRMHPKKTVGKFLKEHPTGTFILTVRRHAFTIKDGKLFNFHSSLGMHIECYWRVTKIKGPSENLAPVLSVA